MRRVPCLALAALLMIVAMPPAMAATAPDGMVRLEQFLERAQSMRAEFRQEVRNGEQQVVDRAEGRVVLKRPGRFRWDYERPYERVVVADGKRLWLYEADLSQVTVRPLTDALGETPAALLTGDRRILERFERVSSWAGDQLAWGGRMDARDFVPDRENGHDADCQPHTWRCRFERAKPGG